MTTHICIWFEDGGPSGLGELVCVCGERAVVVVDEEGVEAVVVLATSAASVRRQDELAMSA